MHVKPEKTELNSKTDVAPGTHFKSIEVFHNGKEASFKPGDLPVNIGRDPDSCQLVTQNTMASRLHCSIEIRNNQPGLLDKSTNGTWIKLGRSESVHVRNDFYPLVGQGTIKPGENITTDDRNTILFKVIL